MTEEPRSRWFLYLLCAGLCVISLLLGGYIGAHLGSSAMINNWVTSQSNYAQTHILILRQMRGGDDDAALEQLEGQLDRDIISLLPDFHGDYWLSDETRTRLEAVLRQARQYRDEFPRQTQGGEAMEEDLRRALTVHHH